AGWRPAGPVCKRVTSGRSPLFGCATKGPYDAAVSTPGFLGHRVKAAVGARVATAPARSESPAGRAGGRGDQDVFLPPARHGAPGFPVRRDAGGADARGRVRLSQV